MPYPAGLTKLPVGGQGSQEGSFRQIRLINPLINSMSKSETDSFPFSQEMIDSQGSGLDCSSGSFYSADCGHFQLSGI